MHYRTRFIDFLEPSDAFLAEFSSVTELDGPEFDLNSAPQDGTLHVLFPAPPAG